MHKTRPLVGLPADTYERDGFLFHSLGDKYVRALTDISDVEPVMIPAFIDTDNLDDLLGHFDGVLMTGAVSNVHPPHYGEDASTDHEPYDHHRDATTLKLIKAVIARGIPLFCICRGFQELNVVMGGSLETELQRGDGRLDHRAPKSEDVDERYEEIGQRHAKNYGWYQCRWHKSAGDIYDAGGKNLVVKLWTAFKQQKENEIDAPYGW